jgi:hypothetical protein
VEVFARIRALGVMESKIIRVGLEISFGTRILIVLCLRYSCTVGRDRSMYGYVPEGPSSCFGCWSQTVPITWTIAVAARLLFKVHMKILSLGW